MKVGDLIDEIRYTSGSHLNSFLNLDPSLDIESIKKARMRFIVRVNNAIKDICTTFAINHKYVKTMLHEITINDKKFNEFGVIKVNGVPILPKKFLDTGTEVYFEKVAYNSIVIHNKRIHDEVQVDYFNFSDLVRDWEDEFPLGDLFIEAVKSHIVMSESIPETTTASEIAPSMAFNAYRREIEKLEALGHRKVDLLDYNEKSNLFKGWLEW